MGAVRITATVLVDGNILPIETQEISCNATEQAVEKVAVTDERTHDGALFEMRSWLDRWLILVNFA